MTLRSGGMVHLTNYTLAISSNSIQLTAAIATSLAAVATAWMALKTRTLAKETKDVATATAKEAEAVQDQGKHIAVQAEATSGALKAAVLPWITWEPSIQMDSTWTPPGFGDTLFMAGPSSGVLLGDHAQGVRGAILIRNVGPGIALIDASKCWVIGGDPTTEVRVEVGTSQPVLPSGETSWLTFKVGTTSAAWSNMDLERFTNRGQTTGSCVVDIAYTDVAGASTWRVRMNIAGIGNRDGWSVHHIEYFEGSSLTPTAEVHIRSDR